jgi:hypothetical protein
MSKHLRKKASMNDNPLESVETFIRRLGVLPKPSDYHLVTLWIASTYYTDKIPTTPRLAFLSPEYGCGKTRWLEIIQALSFQSVFLSHVTRSYLMRKVKDIREEHLRPPTLLIDEVDSVWTGGKPSEISEALRAFMNVGYRKGGTYGIVEEVSVLVAGKKVTQRKPVDFDVFAPIAYAGKGDRAPQSVKTRSIEIRLQKRTASEQIEDFHASAVPFQAQELREWLGDWAELQRADIEWESAQLPRDLQDRDRELILPLWAVARLAGWEEQCLKVIDTFAQQRHQEEPPNERKILTDCVEVIELMNKRQTPGTPFLEKITSVDLVSGLNALEGADYRDFRGGKGIESKWLAKSLRLYEIEPKPDRYGVNKDKETKGYHLSQFQNAIRRYCPEDGGGVSISDDTKDTKETERKPEGIMEVSKPTFF